MSNSGFFPVPSPSYFAPGLNLEKWVWAWKGGGGGGFPGAKVLNVLLLSFFEIRFLSPLLINQGERGEEGGGLGNDGLSPTKGILERGKKKHR